MSRRSAATPVLTGAQIGSKLWKMANKLRKAGVRPADYQAYIIPILMFKVISDRTAAERDVVVAEHGEDFWNDHRESLAPFDIPAGLSFEEQRGVALNLGESLSSALVEIEKRNSELAGVFLGTDYARLDDERVRELYKILASVSFSPAQTSQDALGQAYEYLLGEFADSAGAKAGQFFTPVAVAQLLARLVEPRPGDAVYDPTCGSGGLLNAAAEQSAAAGNPRSSIALFGQELDEQSFAIAMVNMFLHENSSQIVQGDTLLDPKFVIDDELRKFSCVVANPPFGLENTAADFWDSDRFGRARWGSVTKKPAELAFVAHIAQSMDATSSECPGRAAIVLPMPALHRGGDDQKARELLLKGGLVDAVVALPPNLFFNTPIPASVLVLRTASRRSDGSVLFVDASSAFLKLRSKNSLTDEHVNAIVAAVLEEAKSTSARICRVPVEDIIAADANLTVARWLDRQRSSSQSVDVQARWSQTRKNLELAARALAEHEEVASDDGEPGPAQVKLGEIAQFPTSTHKHDACTHPYLSFAGLREDGTLDLATGRTDGVLTAHGDTVLSAQGHVRGWVGKKASRLLTQELVAATTLLVVRPIPEKVLPEYLNVWLRSPRGKAAIDAAHGERTSAHRPTLKEIVVPLPSIKAQGEICQRVAKADAVLDAASNLACVAGELHRQLVDELLELPTAGPRDE